MMVRMPGSGWVKKALGNFLGVCGLLLSLLGTHSAIAQTQSYYYFFNNSYAPYTALSTGTKSLVNAGGSQSFLTDTVSIYNAPSCGSRTRGALQVQSVNNANDVLFPLSAGEVSAFGTDYTITMLMRFAGTTATWQRILNNGSASDIGFYATTSGVSFWPATGSIASGVFSTSAYSWITMSYQASTGNFDIYQNGVYLTTQNVSSYAAQANMQAPGMMFLQDDNITVENSPSTWLSYIHVSNAYVPNRTTSNSIFSEFMTYGCNLNSYYWDGSGSTNDSTVAGGTGAWTSAGANWTDTTGSFNGSWGAAATAYFTNTAGTATIASGYSPSVGGLNFASTGYTVAATGTGSLNLGGTSNTITTPTGGIATISAPIAGGATNALNTAGTGILYLTGTNSYTGATTVGAGTLSIGSGSTTGDISTTSAVSVATGAALRFNRSDAYSFGKVISGAGAVNQAGGGTTTLGVANTYTGATTVTAGTLQLGVNNAVPTGSAVSVSSGATLNLANFSQSTSGLTVNGTLALGTNGSLTLTGGTNTIAAITGSGTITVNSGATLTLTGAVSNSGVNIVLAGGTLNLGAFTHSIGTLSLTANSTVNFSSTTSLTVAALAPSTFTLNASGWVSGSSHFYATAISGAPARNTAATAPLNQIALGANLASQTYWSNSANELLVASGAYTYWDTAVGNGAVDGGSGSWDAASPNWTPSGGAPNGVWAGGTNIPIFQATAGTATLANGYAASVGGLTFNTTGYTIAASGTGGLSLANTTNTVTTPAGGTATISAPIANGAGSALATAGTGTLILAGANTYSGTTTVASGSTLQIGNGGTTGTVSSAVTNNSTLIFNRSDATILGPKVTTTLASANTVFAGTGKVTIVGSSNGIVGATSTVTINSGATLQVCDGVSTTCGLGPTNVVVNGEFILNSIASDPRTLGKMFSGNGKITIAGSSSLTLSNVSNFNGMTTIETGAKLALGSGSILGELGTGAIVNSGELFVNRSNTITLSNTISGTGSFTQGGTVAGVINASPTPGTGTTILTGSNSYGATIIRAGTLQVGNGAASGTLGTGAVTNNAALVFNRSDSVNAPSVISGSGSLTQSGSGTLLLANNYSYTGATRVSAGTLVLTGSTTVSSAVTVDSGATLGGTGTAAGTVSVSGTLRPGVSGVGTLSTGALDLASGSTLAMELGAPGTTGGGVNDLVDVAGNLTLGGALNVSALTDFSATGNYTILTYSGTRSGTFSSDNLAALGYLGVIEYNDTLKQVNLVATPRVRITEVSNGGTGSFAFSLMGFGTGGATLTTTTPGIGVSSAVFSGSTLVGASIVQTLPSGWGSASTSVSCIDANGAGTGNGSGNVATMTGNTLTLSSGVMRAGANIVCTFTNTLNGLSGYVFNDGGAPAAGVNSGTPNDGLQNGAEAGLSGIAVSLSNCSGTTYLSTTTDGTGAYSLAIPSAQAGQTVCITVALPAGFTVTGANAAGTALPGGTPISVGDTSYAFNRGAGQVSFTAPLSGAVTLNFGQVPQSTLVQNSVRQGAPGSSVYHRAQVFTAGTGGSLQLSLLAGTASPPGLAWSEVAYLDPGCAGALASGLTKITPPSATLTVTQGQSVCIVVQEILPAGAPSGASNTVGIQALLSLSNTSPTLTASYSVTATTSVAAGPLQVQKVVRNVTQGGSFGTSNQAKSGDTLEYQITYLNLGAISVSGLELADFVSSYASFVSATADALPASLTECSKNTPGNPSPGSSVSCTATQSGGGSGPVSWRFGGSLAPGASGTVRFSVTVN